MFDRLLARGIKQGCITLIGPHGQSESFGQGEPGVTIKLLDRSTDWALAVNPWLKVGEAYMDGKLIIEEGSLWSCPLPCLLIGHAIPRLGAVG